MKNKQMELFYPSEIPSRGAADCSQDLNELSQGPLLSAGRINTFAEAFDQNGNKYSKRVDGLDLHKEQLSIFREKHLRRIRKRPCRI